MNETDETINNSLPKVGDYVTTDTIIGHLGNTGLFHTSYTGKYAGTHLHLKVLQNNIPIDPVPKWGEGSNVSEADQGWFCDPDAIGTNDQQLQWLYNNEVMEPITINFNKRSSWLGGGGDFKSIEGFNPKITKAIKKTDFYLGKDENLDDFKDVYQIYALAAYAGMPITIKVWDGNNVIEEKTENLQSARYIARKNTLNLGDGDIFSERDANFENGRTMFEVKTRWSGDPSWTGDKVTMQDELWIDSKIYHETSCNGGTCKIPDMWTSWRNEKATNRIKLENNTERLSYYDSGIEKPFVVTGENSDTTGGVVPFNKNERYVKFNDINKNAGANYTEGKKVWILAHGWNGQLGVMKEIGGNIKNDEILKDDIVLQLDWREVSWNGLGTDVCRASTWTRPLSFKIKEKLNTWGLKEDDYKNIRLVGHSLGTILNTELGMRLNSQPETTVSLDPPSDPCLGGYNVQDPPGWNNEIKKSDLSRGGQKTRSFVGMQSFAGSQEHNRTAHISTRNDYGNWATNRSEHGWVQQTWQIMLDSDRLENDTLGARDKDSHDSWRRLSEAAWNNPTDEWQDNHAILRNIKPTTKLNKYGKEDVFVQPGEVEYLEYNTLIGIRRYNKK